MKKNYHLIALAALLFAGATFTACSSSSDNDIIEPTPTQPSNGKYTLTVNATKVIDATTRALSPDGNTLNATWTAGDEVKVYSVVGEGPSETESGDPVGTLTAQRTGATTTLSGEFESTYTPTVGAKLRLKLNKDAVYTNQDGTLDYIATHCDKAVADIIVGTVDKETKAVTPTSTASFENQQAIVKFSLKQPDGTAPVEAEIFTVKYASNTYEVTPSSEMSDIYVAILGKTAKDVTLTALGTSGKFTYTKSGVTFQNGRYYAISVKMNEAEATQDLSKLENDYEAPDGALLTGTLSGNHKVSIEAGATVFLKNVTIKGENSESYKWAGITCEGSATIILVGTNTVKGFYQDYPGIYVPSYIYVPQNGKLTIKGSGSLNASSNGTAAGIGGGSRLDCGDIVIEGGTITARGRGSSAGIGSGDHANCGSITINGGTVTATGGEFSAGIGSGEQGTCGSITITNRVTRVTAKGGINFEDVKCIGNGHDGYCGAVTIGGVSQENGFGPNQDDNATYIYQP